MWPTNLSLRQPNYQLTKQIEDLRRKKADLENYALTSSKENIDQEANIGPQYAETSLRLDNDIKILKTEESKLVARIAFSKTQFEKFKF